MALISIGILVIGSILLPLLFFCIKSRKPNLKLLVERKHGQEVVRDYIINKGLVPATSVEVCMIPNQLEYKTDRLIPGEKIDLGEISFSNANYIDYYFSYIKCAELPIVEKVKIIVKIEDIKRNAKLFRKLKNEKS